MPNILCHLIGQIRTWLFNKRYPTANVQLSSTLRSNIKIAERQARAKRPTYCADCGGRLPHTSCVAVSLRKRRVRIVCPNCVVRIGQGGTP